MSSILKALKKLEEEKTLHQEAAAVNISREILRKQSGGRNMALWLWLTILVALAVIAALTALLLTKPPRQPEATAAPPAPAAATTPPPAAGNEVTLAPPDTASRVVASPRPTTAGQRLPAGSLPLPVPPTSGNTTELPASAATAPPPLHAEPVRKPPQRAEQAEPALTLSGIAWNKDSADRLAIINGQPTSTGAIVSGVVVEEILPDRVKVNSAGRSFEIFLGSPAKNN